MKSKLPSLKGKLLSWRENLEKKNKKKGPAPAKPALQSPRERARSAGLPGWPREETKTRDKEASTREPALEGPWESPKRRPTGLAESRDKSPAFAEPRRKRPARESRHFGTLGQRAQSAGPPSWPTEPRQERRALQARHTVASLGSWQMSWPKAEGLERDEREASGERLARSGLARARQMLPV